MPITDRTAEKSVIAGRFRRLRRRIPITQSELGRYIGLCRVSISRIECGFAVPRPSTLRRFLAFESRHYQRPVRMPQMANREVRNLVPVSVIQWSRIAILQCHRNATRLALLDISLAAFEL